MIDVERHPNGVERVIASVVEAPGALVAVALRDLPGQVTRRLTRIEQRVRVAHWIGRTAVEMGGREIVRRLRPEPSSASAPTTSTPTPAAAPPDTPRAAVRADLAGPANMPFDGYDDLTATQIIELLPRLDAVELAAVRDHESSHRARRTVLGRIDQLAPGP